MGKYYRTNHGTNVMTLNHYCDVFIVFLLSQIDLGVGERRENLYSMEYSIQFMLRSKTGRKAIYFSNGRK